ncbi:acid phosphatase [Dentipellis sp. KUC8613]|nr:acid phosphatase [Dentipellis sp. KUC8613]
MCRSAGLGVYRSLRVHANLWKTKTPDLGLPDSFMKRWAQYAPWMPAEAYTPPPSGCSVTQVNLIQRHGARFPTASSGKEFRAAVEKLLVVEKYKADELEFLNDFVYDMGEEDLIPFGAAQSYDSAFVDYNRYSHLVGKHEFPFVRSSSGQRVVDTATNWTAGFAHASHEKVQPSVTVILSEEGNNTLDAGMCPNAGDGSKQSDEWLSIFAPPITARLNKAAPGANLTDDDTLSLMSMCPFHTIVEQRPSPFCSLFTEDEFDGYEYRNDLDKFYGMGHGAYLGRVQGVGYVNELLARLTGKPVHDHTQTNRTLDSSPFTFPLNRTFYADFSHDNEMNAIYSTIGLFQQHLLPGAMLNPRVRNPLRTYILSRIVPFSARMVVERVQCDFGDGERKGEGGPFVRVIVNDAVMPLEFCDGVHGMCTLEKFVESQMYARENGQGDFEKCFDNN